MATITGLTAARMLAIEAASIVNAMLSGDNLILSKHDGTTINLGSVRGPQGLKGDKGDTGATGTGTAGPTGPAGVSWWITTSDVTNISSISGSKVGDIIFNFDTANHTILGVANVATGGGVIIQTATTGLFVGSLRGPAGADGSSGTVTPDATAIVKGKMVLGAAGGAAKYEDLLTEAASRVDLATNFATNVQVDGAHVTVLGVSSTSPGPADVGALDVKAAPGLKTGMSYRWGAEQTMTPSTQDRPTGRVIVHPFQLKKSTKFVTIGCSVKTAGSTGAVARLGIYADDGSGAYPGALIVDAGTVATTATGEKTITINQTLAPGTYWLALAPQGSPTTLAKFACLTSGFPNVGIPAGNEDGTNGFGFLMNSYWTGATGALPTPYPGTTGVDALAPRVYLIDG